MFRAAWRRAFIRMDGRGGGTRPCTVSMVPVHESTRGDSASCGHPALPLGISMRVHHGAPSRSTASFATLQANSCFVEQGVGPDLTSGSPPVDVSSLTSVSKARRKETRPLSFDCPCETEQRRLFHFLAQYIHLLNTALPERLAPWVKLSAPRPSRVDGRNETNPLHLHDPDIEALYSDQCVHGDHIIPIIHRTLHFAKLMLRTPSSSLIPSSPTFPPMDVYTRFQRLLRTDPVTGVHMLQLLALAGARHGEVRVVITSLRLHRHLSPTSPSSAYYLMLLRRLVDSKPGSVRRLMREAEKDGIQAVPPISARLLLAAVRRGGPDLVKRRWQQIKGGEGDGAGLPPHPKNSLLHGLIVDAYLAQGQVEEAVSWHWKTLSKGITPAAHPTNRLLQALCSPYPTSLTKPREDDLLLRISWALKIWQRLEVDKGNPATTNSLPDLYTYSILAYTLARYRMEDGLVSMFARMWERQFPTEAASAVPYNAAITGATDARDWNRVRWVYGQMRGRGQPMTSRTLVALLRAAIHQGTSGDQVSVLLSELARITQASGVPITARHWAMVLDGYGRRGDTHGMGYTMEELRRAGKSKAPCVFNDPEDEGRQEAPQVLLGTLIAGMARAGDMECVSKLWGMLETEGWPFLPSMAKPILKALQLHTRSSSTLGKSPIPEDIGVERIVRALLRDGAHIDRSIWIMAVWTAVQQGRRRDARWIWKQAREWCERGRGTPSLVKWIRSQEPYYGMSWKRKTIRRPHVPE